MPRMEASSSAEIAALTSSQGSSVSASEHSGAAIDDFQDDEEEAPPLTFRSVAALISHYMPPLIGKQHAEDFIVATALTLLPCPVSAWKKLASDKDEDKGKDLNESTTSTMSKRERSNTSVHCLGVKFVSMLEEKLKHKIIDNKDLVKISNFRAATGHLALYFKGEYNGKGSKKSSKEHQKHFSAIWSGFIVKLYFSKVGHNTAYSQVRNDLGDYIATEALSAGKTYSQFGFKLVTPQDMIEDFNMVNAVSDQWPLCKQTEIHILEDGHSGDLQNFIRSTQSKNLQESGSFDEGTINVDEEEDELVNVPIEVSEPPIPVTSGKFLKEKPINSLDYPGRIALIDKSIEKDRDQISYLEGQIAKANARIKAAEGQKLSLRKHYEQQVNDQNLTENLRQAIKGDENAFKTIADVVVDVAPQMIKILPTCTRDCLKEAIIKSINDLLAKGGVAKSGKIPPTDDNSSQPPPNIQYDMPVIMSVSGGPATSSSTATEQTNEFPELITLGDSPNPDGLANTAVGNVLCADNKGKESPKSKLNPGNDKLRKTLMDGEPKAKKQRTELVATSNTAGSSSESGSNLSEVNTKKNPIANFGGRNEIIKNKKSFEEALLE